jgi:hypothetical protein
VSLFIALTVSVAVVLTLRKRKIVKKAET